MFAFIVLYRMRAEESPAYLSMRDALRASPEADAAIELTLHDNSPDFQPAPDGFTGEYRRDPSNPGLARPYNLTLAAAREAGMPWLLVLDQDTTVTDSYLQELLALIDGPNLPAEVCAIIPKLMEGGIVQSPRLPPAVGRFPVLDPGVYGVARQRLHAYNSGSALRVAALAAAGGFSELFPLDYLDHATFHRLQAEGGRLFIMRSALEHRLSGNREGRYADPAYLRRLRQVWKAERLFYRRFGTAEERLLCRWRFLKRAWKASRRDAWRECLLHLKHAFTP